MRSAIFLSMVLSLTAYAQERGPTPPPKEPPAQQPSQLRSQQVRVTVEGCLSGKHLLPSLSLSPSIDENLLNASEFILEGPPDLMRQLLSDHDAHLERISGLATIPQPEGTTVETHGVTKGKTRVTTGVRATGGESRSGGATVSGDAKLPVRLRVQATEHLAEKCARRP
jgi:hypothetical protein